MGKLALQSKSARALDSQNETASENTTTVYDPQTQQLSQPFVVHWTQLISRTNWEKGKIISQWRQALAEASANPSTYSDEAWCRQVGGVTSQHVGRLRRVYDRFYDSYETYQGLYWTHFMAALDWDDAEMWLEGAVRSHWSVSSMRRTRWESMGSDPNVEPQDSEVVSASDDEDYTPLAEIESDVDTEDGPRNIAEGPRAEDPDFGDEPAGASATPDDDDDELPWEDSAAQESPFASLPSLPVDFAEAVEQFKLAIIRHRSTGWSEVSQEDVLKSLKALSQFTQLTTH